MGTSRPGIAEEIELIGGIYADLTGPGDLAHLLFATSTAVPTTDARARLTLSMAPGAADLRWANSGAMPVHIDHLHSLSMMAGVMSAAWLDTDGAHGIMRFSEMSTGRAALKDVRAGCIAFCSVTAKVRAVAQIPTAEGEPLHFMATRWSAEEVSLTAMPRDRSCRLLEKDESDTQSLALLAALKRAEGTAAVPIEQVRASRESAAALAGKLGLPVEQVAAALRSLPANGRVLS